MKILLVGGFSTDDEEVASLKSLNQYMQDKLTGHTVLSTHLDEIVYTLSSGKLVATIPSLQVTLDEVETVYIRGPKMRMRSEQAYYLSRFCANNGIRCINDYSLYYPGTKVAQAIIFYEEQAPFLDTIYTLSNTTLIAIAETQLGYPYILKTTSGSHGDANYLIHSRVEAEHALEQDRNVDFLAQRFCENDRDYRVLVTPNASLTFARKGSADTHLNNTSKGADAMLAAPDEVPEELIEKSRQVAARLKLELAGVDVMPKLGTEEFYFLEINSQPQFVTGALLEEKARLIRSLFAGE